MAVVNNAVVFATGTYAQYSAGTKNADTIYFTSDTNQIFVGAEEYTKSYKTLSAAPTTSTAGEIGQIAGYNGNVYACTAIDGNEYTWVRIANVNDTQGTVTSISVGTGLTTPDNNPIVSAGTISHAVPTGAAAHTDSFTDQTPGMGDSFNIESISTDTMGHVTAINTTTVTLPDLISSTDTEVISGGTFTAVESVAEDSDGNLAVTTTTFTLPVGTTYTLTTGDNEGTIKVTPSTGTAYNVLVKDWDTLAKKSEIASVFDFKGTVATVADLPTTGNKKGDVYHVTEGSAEYVWTSSSTSGTAADWEELGTVMDLSAYALSADVIQRVTGETDEVPVFTADGTLASSNKTIADLTYVHPTHTAYASNLYKITVDELGHVTAAVAVTASDIAALGVEITDENVESVPDTTSTVSYLVGTTSGDTATGTLKKNVGIYADNSNGSIHATGGFVGNASTATALETSRQFSITGGATAAAFDFDGTDNVVLNVTSLDATKLTGTASINTTGGAANDGAGNNIVATYATKQELSDATLVWNAIV